MHLTYFSQEETAQKKILSDPDTWFVILNYESGS